MGWDESLFQKTESWLRRIDQKRKGTLPTQSAVYFLDMKSRIHHWVALLSGRTWTLQEAETWPAFDEERLFFPSVLEIFNDSTLNQRAYLYIASCLIGLDETHFPELKQWRIQFQRTYSQKESCDFENYSAVQYLNEPDAVPVCGDIPVWTQSSFRSLMNLWCIRKLSVQAQARSGKEDHRKSQSADMATHKKKAREQIQIIESLDDQKNENPLVHSFEKLHTTDDYNGGSKKHDGDDEMQEHAESLEDLDLRQVVRTSQDTRANLKGDYVMDLDVAESEDLNQKKTSQIYRYDEWDEASGFYHKDWCTLEEMRSPAIEEDHHQHTRDLVISENKSKINQLRRLFFQLFQSPKWQNRQLDGYELDLEELVDIMAMPIEKRPEKIKIYRNRQKSLNELSVILLLDRSLSSDSWVNNKRVLDVIRDSLIIIGEAIKRFHFPVQLAAFSSHTRNKISYEILKDFDQDWGEGLKRLSTVEPIGYTRIGPVLRHAISELKEHSSKHKWIIILSDSKPTDFDKYEGRYGTRDVRKAIHEAKLHRIGVRCLSIDKLNREELTEMYGARGFELLTHIDQISNRLGLLLKALVQKSM